MTSLACSWEKCTQEQVASLRCRCHSCSFKAQFQIWILWLFMDAETCVSPSPSFLKTNFHCLVWPAEIKFMRYPKAYQFLCCCFFFSFFNQSFLQAWWPRNVLWNNTPIFLLLKWLENVGSSVVNPPASSCNFKDSKISACAVCLKSRFALKWIRRFGIFSSF